MTQTQSPAETSADSDLRVPFLDLKAQQADIRDDISAAIEEVVDNTAFAGGPAVERFETDFAEFCGTRRAVGVGSGTDALWLALLGFGVGPGDEVITVANTFIATAEAVSFTGAKPVLVDAAPGTYTLDPEKLEAAITERTRAVMPVHLYGRTAEMEPIVEIAKRRGLRVIEDASQAHGAAYGGRRAGALADAGCFSFYPGKNLGAWGEAGAVVTDNEELATRIKRLRDHGQEKKYYHSDIGWNGRMDGIQGAVLGVKLRHLPAWNEGRRRAARRYDELLSGIDALQLPSPADDDGHVYHIYAVHTDRRDALLERLKERNVFCGIHYPMPIHLQEAYRSLGHKAGDFPVAEENARRELSLPMFAELTDEQIEKTAREIRAFFDENA